jgi:hypothetical protein
MSPTMMISKKVTKGEDLVVVRRHDYEQLLKNFFEAKDALAKIRRGEKELKQGKTRVVQSLAQLRD